jgi:lysophospholipase L1-like esterase
MRLPILASFALIALCACGSKADPFAGQDAPSGSGTGSGTFDAPPPGDNPDAAENPDAGAAACAPKPARMVILGDSIASCYGVGNGAGADCGYKQFHDYLAAHYATGVTYTNSAVPGAVTMDLLTQMKTVATGAGHVLIVVQDGGNDLAPYIFQTDPQAQAAYDALLPKVKDTWAQTFAYFADKTKFPDGVTLMIGNQYDPFDDCTAPPYNLSALKITLLHKYNSELAAIVAGHPEGVLVDQFTSYLGHGHHNAVTTCPHYMPNMANWMADLIHPNVAGHMHLASVLDASADSVYGAGCK